MSYSVKDNIVMKPAHIWKELNDVCDFPTGTGRWARVGIPAQVLPLQEPILIIGTYISCMMMMS